MKIEDDRTVEQKNTHTMLVIGHDNWMSGWGEAERGQSYAAWATEPEHVEAVLEAVKERGDMDHVHSWSGPGEYPLFFGVDDHLHIYVVKDGHCPWVRCKDGDE